MIRIATVDISPLTETEYGKLYERASEERRKRADRYLRTEDSYRCILAEALLRYALKQSPGICQAEPVKAPGEKPYLPGQDRFEFNLSHSGRWVVLAWGERPVGVDVEIISMDPGKEQLALRYFQQEEQDYLFAVEGQDRARRFFELWTKKESYLKYRGTGITCALNSFSVLDPQALDVTFHVTFLEDAVLTLCAQGSAGPVTQIPLPVLLSE